MALVQCKNPDRGRRIEELSDLSVAAEHVVFGFELSCLESDKNNFVLFEEQFLGRIASRQQRKDTSIFPKPLLLFTGATTAPFNLTQPNLT